VAARRFGASLAGLVSAATLGSVPGAWGVLGHVGFLAIFAVPVTMGVAILKYRLYDIDRIISRTLAYAIVTGLLIGVVRRPGAARPAGPAVPRHGRGGRLHAGRGGAVRPRPAPGPARPLTAGFNRTRYDADQTIADFAARLQDAVDLDAVRDDLAGVVRTALEPAHLTLWTAPRQ